MVLQNNHQKEIQFNSLFIEMSSQKQYHKIGFSSGLLNLYSYYSYYSLFLLIFLCSDISFVSLLYSYSVVVYLYEIDFCSLKVIQKSFNKLLLIMQQGKKQNKKIQLTFISLKNENNDKIPTFYESIKALADDKEDFHDIIISNIYQTPFIRKNIQEAISKIM